jgi:hypothetical protein
MEKLKLCEICGKEVIPGRDKHLNILNRYYHEECLSKEKVVKKGIVPDFTQDQVAKLTFEEKLVYLDERIRNLTSKYNVPEDEAKVARMILRQISEEYEAAAKSLEKTKKSSSN